MKPRDAEHGGAARVGTPTARPIREVPDALEREAELHSRLEGATPAVFLDYDGTLTPIVADPSRARLPDETRAALERLRGLCPVAVVSGRDLAEVRRMVRVDGIHYAGSHGFDVLTPSGERRQRGTEYLPALARAEGELTPLLEGIEGVTLERKGFALAVHYRRLRDPSDEARVREAVERVVAEMPRIRCTGGKKIFELRPDVAWDKGRAVRWILDGVDPQEAATVPLYVGDDVTDEDAFRAVADDGISVVVRGEDDDRETAADFALDDPGAVRRLLERIADFLEASSADPGGGGAAR